MDFKEAMDAVFEGKVVQQDHQAWRDLGRKIMRNPRPEMEKVGQELKPKEVKREDIERHLVKVEKNEVVPYKVVPSDKAAEWVIG